VIGRAAAIDSTSCTKTMVTNSEQQEDEQRRATIQAVLNGVPAKDKHMAALFQLIYDEIGNSSKKLGTRIDNMGTRIDNLSTQIELLVDATPAAANIPKVFVAGCKKTAQLTGAAATWTLVKAATSDVTPAGTATTKPTNTTTTTTTVVSPEKQKQDNRGERSDNDVVEFTYLLVSSAHCIRTIRNGNDNGKDVSLISLSKDIASFLLSPILKDAGVRVTSVGFHTKVMKKNANEKLPASVGSLIDIVFLKLSGKPPSSIVSDKFAIPEIIPVDAGSVLEPGQQNVAGTALSGRVNGTGLQYDNKKNVFSFLADFAEKGTSGTVMYTAIGDNQQALGCFKGTSNDGSAGMHLRGIIVPFPRWEDIEWIECKKQPESFGTTFTLPSGLQMERTVQRDGCSMYLTLARCMEHDFTSKHDVAFDGSYDDDDEVDF
jgi:hypothetical protein